jgi:hypothetical protein
MGALAVLAKSRRLPGALPDHPDLTSRLTLAHPSIGVLRWAMAAGVFGLTFLFRLIDAEFTNDHFFWIAGGRQILVFGELPIRDFWDPGYFLQHFASAGVQWLFGHSLLGELLLSVLAIALGTAMTFLLASRASNSLWLGLLVTLLVVLSYPRLYNYHKIFFFVSVLLLLWRYVDRPTRANLVLVALATATAGLFRHDYAIYLVAAGLVALAARHSLGGARVLASRVALYLGVLGLVGLPFVVFVLTHSGIATYLTASTAFAQREQLKSAERIPPPWLLDRRAPLIMLERPANPGARVSVRWVDGLSDQARALLEQQYALGSPQADLDRPGASQNERSARTWHYRLQDSSERNVGALLSDPAVDDTDGLDRVSGRATESPTLQLLRRVETSVPLLGVRLAPGLIHSGNALPWLYYLFVALPIVVLATLGSRLRHSSRRSALLSGEVPKMAAVAALCVVATPILFRDPLQARIADVAPPLAVLGAWLLAQRPAVGRVGQVAVRLSMVGIVLLTTASIASVSEGRSWIGRVELVVFSGPRALWHEARGQLAAVSVSPPIDGRVMVGDSTAVALMRYIQACSAPSDRLLVSGFMPQFYYFTGRGYPTWWGYQHQPVPIIVATAGSGNRISGLRSGDLYVNEFFYPVGSFDEGGQRSYTILVDRRREPTGTYPPLALPCYA